jgi:integrase
MSELPQLTTFGNEHQKLPPLVTTRSGVQFDPSKDIWAFRDSLVDIKLNFGTMNASFEIIINTKRVLIWYAENKSIFHMRNIFDYFTHFVKTISSYKGNIVTINSSDIINYRDSLDLNKEYYLGTLSGFFKKWHDLGYAGISDDAIHLLKQLRIKGNEKGRAVLTMDLQDGPFSAIEFEAIHEANKNAFETGEISLEEYVLVWIFIALAPRPIQIASLKVCDVGITQSKDGTTLYSLNLPQAKKREQLARSVFAQKSLISQVGEKLAQHSKEVRIKFSLLLSDEASAPLFPAKRSRRNEPKGFEFHQTSQGVRTALQNTLNNLKIISERTGKPLHITATRFRRTLGTNLAIEGYGELVIAEALGHSDTQNAGVYVQATPQIVERIDKAVSMQLAPLAQAFSGVIIKNESQATRANDPSSRVCDPRFDSKMKPMGNCGEFGFCGELAPIACYTCRKFEPWLDGPHEKVLNHLISERERLLKTTDERVASINDRTILAVAEVVRRCDEIKSQTSDKLND